MGMPPIATSRAAALAPLGRQCLAACQRRLKPDPLLPLDGASCIPEYHPSSPLPFDHDACASLILQSVTSRRGKARSAAGTKWET
jgi:hypothetical protein